MRTLYPEIQPYDHGHLDVGDGHSIFYEVSGNPNGKPVVFIHGGPGGGSIPDYRRYFDPEAYRIVLFDQRGCGKSTPYASLENNTTWHLVADIEKLREHLKIATWVVFGGSWGSTLSLAYAEKHPEKVQALVLRGIFMLRPKEIRWFYQEGASFIYPDAWETYLGAIPEEEHDDLVKAYYKRLTSEDPQVRKAAARAWSVWEGSTSKLIQDPKLIESTGDEVFAVAFARIECHYFTNGGFFDHPEQILNDIHKVKHIPTTIVQGRYDVV
ncbi:MAG: prolyl aminopeptidase, partial [Candidatus Eisenbacteria bacterium]|nr:prolyl aminopeptidase [Candidatus Eisenbacteria bacterium]